MDDCLSSALDQDAPEDEYEVIYADNASTDGSADYVREKFPRARVVQFDRNWGFATGNNHAIPETSGQWIVFLNQDTVCARSWLRELLAAVESSPEIMAGHANVIHPWYPDFGGLALRAESPNAYTPVLSRWGYLRYRHLGELSRPMDVAILSGAALALNRVVIDDLGHVFDDDLWAYAEDWDLGFRLQALGHRCVLAPRATVYHLYTAKTGLRWANWVGTMRNLRNRYIAFYKVSTWKELMAIASLLTLGSPLNAFEFGLRVHQKLLFATALVPTTIVAVSAAVMAFSRFSAKRREILRSRSDESVSILSRIWRG
jgi:GT2 family glycosyltransferase